MRTIFQALYLTLVVSAAAAELPNFADYPVPLSEIDHYAKAIVPAVDSASRCIRDLPYERPEPPNFADRFTLFVTGCGTGCVEFCVIDRASGAVFPGFGAAGGPKLEFKRASRLVIMRHTQGTYGADAPFYADCYVWETDRFRFVGRWATKYGIAQREKHIAWSPEISVAPNWPTWRSK